MSKSPIDMMLDGATWTPVEGEHDPESDLPYATHEGVLELGDMKLRVYQLNTGLRVIEESDFIAFFDSKSK